MVNGQSHILLFTLGNKLSGHEKIWTTHFQSTDYDWDCVNDTIKCSRSGRYGGKEEYNETEARPTAYFEKRKQFIDIRRRRLQPAPNLPESVLQILLLLAIHHSELQSRTTSSSPRPQATEALTLHSHENLISRTNRKRNSRIKKKQETDRNLGFHSPG